MYLGSDNALDNEDKWVIGSILTFIETVIFTIVMLTLETDDLHTMRSRGTAYHLTYIMVGAFIAKTGLYYYIEKKMAEADAAREAEEEAALGNQKVVKETPEIETFVTTYFEFPGTFTTNLLNSRKFLQVGLGVSTQYDDTVMANVEGRQTGCCKFPNIAGLL